MPSQQAAIQRVWEAKHLFYQIPQFRESPRPVSLLTRHNNSDKKSLTVRLMGRRPLPAVRDLTRDGRWSTYDVSVSKMGGKMRTDRTPYKATITNKSYKQFPPASLAGRLAGPVFYVYVFSLVRLLEL